MEAVTKPTPAVESEPEIRLNPADVYDVEELTPEELKALTSETADEKPTEKNPSKSQIAEIGISLVGGIAGFFVVGYANNYIMQYLQKNASSPLTPSTLLTYAAVVFVAELLIGGFLIYYGMKHSATKNHMARFLEDFGVGAAVAGAGTFLTQYLINQGGSNIVLPAVDFAGKPLVSPTRVVGT